MTTTTEAKAAAKAAKEKARFIAAFLKAGSTLEYAEWYWRVTRG